MLQTCSYSTIDVTDVEYSSTEQWRKHIDLCWILAKLRSALDATSDSTIAPAPTGKRQRTSNGLSDPPFQKRVKLPPTSETPPLLPIWAHRVEATLLRNRNHVWEAKEFGAEEAEIVSASILLGKCTGDELSLGVGHVRTASKVRGGIYTTEGTIRSNIWQSERHERILSLPTYDDGLGQALDFPNPMCNLLFAACVAHSTGRFYLAPVDIGARLDDSQDDSETGKLPVCITLTFRLFINPANLFEPVGNISPFLAEAQRRILSYVLPQPTPVEGYPGETNIRYFFSCLSPAPPIPQSVNQDALQPRDLQVQLFPFQKRSVHFLLQAEGMTIGSHGEAIQLEPMKNRGLLWEPIYIQWSSEISRVWFQHLSGDIRITPPCAPSLPGVMLSETMGLGKTVEIIALVLLYTPTIRNTLHTVWDRELEVQVKPIKASLIVTPSSLIQQWRDEFATRAPKLKVLLYEGKSKLLLPQTKQQPKMLPFDQLGGMATETWHTAAKEYDIIITTCCVQTLQADLHIARPPTQRSRRAAVDYAVHSRPRSPLVLVEVIMDEAQHMGSGKAAEMVALTRRHVSIAVSGTPARSNVKDLIHVLRFLRVPNVVSNKLWTRLTSPSFAHVFGTLFRSIAVRTSKKIASSELALAEQRRFVLPVQLGPIERHNYNERMAESLTALGLDESGIPLSPQCELDATLLRTSIRRLRQACTHPQIGNALGGTKVTTPKISSIDHVLACMVDDNKRYLWDLRRTLIVEQMTHVLLRQKLEDNPTKDKDAVVALLGVQSDIKQHIMEIQNAKVVHACTLGRSANGDGLRNAHIGTSPTALNSSAQSGDVAPHSDADATSSDSDGVSDAHGTSSLAQKSSRADSGHTARLRDARTLLHKVHFLLGDAYHRLGFTEEEDRSYGAAEHIRKQLLQRTELRAEQTMQRLRGRRERDLKIREQFKILPAENPGKKTVKLFEEVNKVVLLLNKQAELLWRWMDDVTNLLIQQFSTEDPADGGEYARALDTQTNAECFVVAIAALLADRRETMNAERTTLASHEYKDIAKRKTLRALNAETDATHASLKAKTSEQVVLRSKLADLRKMLKCEHTKPLKIVMFELGRIALEDGLGAHSSHETSIAVAESKRLKVVLENQEMLLDEVENSTQALRRAFNDRVAYFRNLQELSDSVEDVVIDVNTTLHEALEVSRTKMAQVQAATQRGLAKQRYLRHLSNQYGGDALDEESKYCVLCKCDFSKGVVTECAHVFCLPCLTAWIKKRREGKSCPVCRQSLDATSIHRISVANSQTKPETKLVTVDDLLNPHRSTLKYRIIDSDVLKKISSRESVGQFGSKIQTLVKHLLCLQDNQPGSKSICFSAWSDSLAIVSYALEANGIPYLRIDGPNKKANPAHEFQTNPDYQVLLLHGGRDNAGLNVTAARHVFLLEPVVNHSFEVQALARVDRLGGQDTEVYCYYAEDTVEKNILDLAHRRGNSLYTYQVAELNTDIAGERATRKALGRGQVQKGDFVASTEDMLAIMFPHIYQDMEETEEDVESMMLEAGSSIEREG